VVHWPTLAKPGDIRPWSRPCTTRIMGPCVETRLNLESKNVPPTQHPRHCGRLYASRDKLHILLEQPGIVDSTSVEMCIVQVRGSSPTRTCLRDNMGLHLQFQLSHVLARDCISSTPEPPSHLLNFPVYSCRVTGLFQFPSVLASALLTDF
jgi:hypothetical protein